MNADPERLALRGRLTELEEDEMPKASASFDNAVTALRQKITLYETPADVDMKAVSAAAADMGQARENFIQAQVSARELRRRLGL